jgi:hypothetical protein
LETGILKKTVIIIKCIITIIIIIIIRKTLDETTAELKKTSRLLEAEKQKTDNLLYQMLPHKVANDLKNGLSIAAGKEDKSRIFLRIRLIFE